MAEKVHVIRERAEHARLKGLQERLAEERSEEARQRAQEQEKVARERLHKQNERGRT